MPKETTSKETVETRSYSKKLFMVKFPEVLGRTTCITEDLTPGKVGHPVTNEEILHIVNEERNILHSTLRKRPIGLVTSCDGTAF
jgi:hypothetical protein